MPRTSRSLAALAATTLALAGCSDGGGKSGSGSPTSATSSAADAGAFDVKAENAKPGTTAWNFGKSQQASDTELAGFLDHDSVRPGDKLSLKATSTAPQFAVTAYRMGWYGGKGGREIWSSGPIKSIAQPAPKVLPGNEIDCSNWKSNATVDTAGWPEGLYLLRMNAQINGATKSKWIPLVVRSQTLRGKLGLIYATPTYQAYNEWGGWSLYGGKNGGRATHVSFNRPYDKSGARVVTAGERQITALAEREGLNVGYATQLDVNSSPSIVDGARGLVSGGHDEYWTPTVRAAWEGARDKGTNLAFFGANAVYWRIRVEGRTVVGYKAEAANDPVQGAETTAMWRANPQPKPENSLTGQLYECFPARGPLVVTDPGFWMFAGTGAKQGSQYNGLVGVEIDRAYPIKGTPKTLHVAAHTPVDCSGYGSTFSDLTYYTATSGAGVFASGSMSWAVGLLGPNKAYNIDEAASQFSQKASANLLTAMAAGPLGKMHPAVGNLAELHASSQTSTGSGGPIGGSASSGANQAD